MDIPGAAGHSPSSTTRKGDSFAESLHKEGPAGGVPQFASAKSFSAGDLATNLGYVSPDFMPAAGDEMFGAIALGEGANDEMRRFEEKVTHPDDPTGQTPPLSMTRKRQKPQTR